MSTATNALPEHRPLMIAHRAGNSLATAEEAIRIGADLLETDIWLHGGKLEIRHPNRRGPILWERWRVRFNTGPWPTLRQLLDETPEAALLFLDLKGDNRDLGPRILEELGRAAPGRPIAVCGRDYPQLDPLIDVPGITLFYSVGEQKEWASAWPRLEAMTSPAVSLKRHLASEPTMARLKEMGATVVCWGVNTPEELERLHAMGVDGFTTDNKLLIRQVSATRQRPFSIAIQPRNKKPISRSCR